MSPLVHSPAPSSADELSLEVPRLAPNSPEPEFKRRKRADDNSISRCELCKQRKVRSHSFVSSHVTCFRLAPLLPAVTCGGLWGYCAYVNVSRLTYNLIIGQMRPRPALMRLVQSKRCPV